MMMIHRRRFCVAQSVAIAKKFYHTSDSLKVFNRILTVAKITRELQSAVSDYTYLPTMFTVPYEEPWPKNLQGETLNVNYLRNQYHKELLPEELVESFNKLNFVWNIPAHKWTLRFSALQTYLDIYGDLAVPHGYIIPDSDPKWPKDAWNTRLGYTVNNIRSGAIRINKEQRLKLDEMGFVWDAFRHDWEIHLQAMRIFQEKFGHVDVPQHFVVPESWPAPTGGLPLGIWANNIRYCRLTQEKKDQLNELGFKRRRKAIYEGLAKREERGIQILTEKSAEAEARIGSEG